MASIHKQPGKPCWFCAYSEYDKELGKWQRRFRSTKSTKRKEAEDICKAWEQAARMAYTGRLTPDAAREVIARGVSDVFLHANQDELPRHTIRAWCEQWLQSKQIEAADSTATRYEGVLQRFYTHLGKRSDRDLAALQPKDVVCFRDTLARDLSRNTANSAIKTLRACFNAAFKQGVIGSNPAAVVDKLKQRGESNRRPFTLAELKRVLKAAQGSDWYGMTLIGLYHGLRISDAAALTWRAVDMTENRLSFTVKKTRQRLIVPLAQPVAAWLATLPAADNPDAALFPALASKSASKLSEGFRTVLADTGLAKPLPKNHASQGKGRGAARELSELSFHSLRHSFVSILKSVGANEAVAMALAGHETRAMSQHYTTLDEATLRSALDKLPDVTAQQ